MNNAFTIFYFELEHLPDIDIECARLFTFLYEHLLDIGTCIVINDLLWTVISSRCVYNALYDLFLSSICNSCLLLCFFQTPTNVHRTMAVAPKDVSTLMEATDVNVLTAINWTAEICILVSVSTRCEVTTFLCR